MRITREEERFQLSDEKALDPVGNGFSMDEGIGFINNADPDDYSYDLGNRVW